MSNDDGRPVHQLLFGLTGDEGFALVGHSMLSDSEALSWQRRLEQHQHARLLPWGTESPPEKALSYYQFGDEAVVLRRWAVGGSLGRSDAHALIGPADVLTVPVALGLDSGFGWRRDADAVRTSLVGLELASAAEAKITVAELRAGAARRSEMLRRALGKLIDAQTKPLTIIGCPDEDRVALTWALVHIGNEYLIKTSQTSRSWTFSTYEIADTDSIPGLPGILFMPGKPIGRGVASREIVDVSRDDTVSREAGVWAGSLVKRFISREPLLPEFDDQAATPAAGAMPISAGPHVRRVQERPPEPAVPGPRPYQVSTAGSPKDRSQAAENSPHPPVPTTRKIGSQRLEKELDYLFDAEDRDSFKWHLTPLGRDVGERTEIRRILSVDNYLKIIIAITRWYPQADEMAELFRRLRVVTFGPDGRDLADPDVVVFALQLVEHPAAPDSFVYDLVENIEAKGQLNRVVPVLAARWRAQHDPARQRAGTSQGRRGTARTGRSGEAPALLTQRRWPLVAAGIVLVSLFFVVGRYSVGAGTSGAGSSGQGTPTTQPTTSPPAGVQQGKEDIKPVVVSGGVATHDLVIRGPWHVAGDKTMVFVLLRPVSETSSYYSEAVCTADANKQEWVCDKLPLVAPSTIRPPFEVLVVRINSQDMPRYQDSMNTKTPLQGAPPNSMDVIFKDSGRS